ncbi:MAG: hypothetical protein Q7U04_03885 [Bacteriovorax sp.]|nr:hypothetical protein [Bacteriovorax sp.]
MVITGRDRELLLKLHSYGLIATNQVKKIVFNDIAAKKPESLERYPFLLTQIIYCGVCGDKLCLW